VFNKKNGKKTEKVLKRTGLRVLKRTFFQKKTDEELRR